MPRDVLPVDADGAILLRAAEVIDDTGWWNGEEENYKDGRQCAVMAISAAVAIDSGIITDVLDRLALRLGVADRGIAHWNDTQPNAEAVTSRLRAAAYAPVPA